MLRDVTRAWEDNHTFTNLLAYTWTHNDERILVVVNFSDMQSQGRVPMPDIDLDGAEWKLTDRLDDNKIYHRDGDRMHTDGLYIDLMPWQGHIFSMKHL